MASSRSPSPAGSASSPPGTPPTPGAVIKALLATVESSSDEESRPAPKSSTTSPKQKSAKLASISPYSAASSSDEDEDDILRPRGKLAARMLAHDNTRTQSPSKTGLDARERVRMMLQKAADPKKSKEAGADVDDDEDDIVAPRPRKLQPRRARSQTPEAVDKEQETAAQSPGVFVSPATSQSIRARSATPGLFVSSPAPPNSRGGHSNGAVSDDSDKDLPSIKNARFKALVMKKRQERLAKEAEEERKKAARMAAHQAASDLMSDEGDDSNISDDEGGRKLSQTARPTRKASKKALEEMSRETQRLNRSLQLAHEPKTKKKITKASLFERFNFKPEGGAMPKTASSSRPASPVSAHQTDTEMRDVETPPSSPPAPPKSAEKAKTPAPENHVQSVLEMDSGDDLPTLEEALAATTRQEEKGKGRATAADLEEESKPVSKPKRGFRVKLPVVHAQVVTLGSDDELDIQPPKGNSKIDALLARVPANKDKESRSMYTLRRLANIDDPDRKGAPLGKRDTTKPSMTSAELKFSLQRQARLQAKLERERRLEFLKSNGVHIPTEEEREKERAEVEDIVARAREEAEEIMLREREAAKKDKKERKEAGEVDPLAWEDSDASDDDYEEEKVEEKAIELSGSEEEDEEMEDEDEEMEDEDAEGDEEGMESVKDGLVDDVAEEGTESEDGKSADAESEAEEAVVPSRQAARRPKKHVTIISDDESDQGDRVEATPRPKVLYPKSPSAPNTVSPKVPTSVLRSATKTFIPGLPVAGPAGLGLTQIFAGTMDDSQAGPFGASPSQLMPTFDNFPDSQFSQSCQEPPEELILDSQNETQAAETQGVQLHFSQSQMHGFDSFLQQTECTQMSELIEPTQDGGFQEFTPLKQRFVEPPTSTIDTVVLSESQRNAMNNDSPLVQRAGKLRRRADVMAAATAAALSGDDEEDGTEQMEGVEYDEFGFGTTSAFSLMKDAAVKEKKLKAKAEFDKKKSKAREMVEDQAEESEDEYAGIGGADGEDSDDDSNASVHEMVDDQTRLSEADKAKLKAFYADRERASDEKQVEKLFKDITSGMLRRKRGADYDLSDSDDGGEARRRMKRRQFAKMQKALFADERISKVAENPRTSAFLRTIEDRGSDDDMDFLFAPTAPAAGTDSEDTSSQGPERVDAVPDSQPEAAAARAPQRLPGPQRRTRDGRKPTTIGDIRASLSDLLDDRPATGSTIIPATDLGSSDHGDDDDDDADAEDEADAVDRDADADKENRNPNPRRSGRVAVVDRITLKRNASSSSNVSTESNSSSSVRGRLAFAAPASSAGGFKVPALLRRATTNSLLSGSSTSTVSTAVQGGSGGGFGEEAKIKRNAGKRSGINYFARENERRAALAESEKRREAKKWKGAVGRGEVVGNLFGGGRFE